MQHSRQRHRDHPRIRLDPYGTVALHIDTRLASHRWSMSHLCCSSFRRSPFCMLGWPL